MNKTKLWFDGVSISKGHCSTFPTNIRLRKFNFLMVVSPEQFYETKLEEQKEERLGRGKVGGNGTSLTEDEILRWYNEAETAEYRDGILTITTEHYIFSVFITSAAKKTAGL